MKFQLKLLGLSILLSGISIVVSAQDSSGTYVPTFPELINISPGTAVAGTAHFIKKGHEVSVWGRVGVSGVINQGTGARTAFAVSLPFAIDTTIEYDAAVGMLSSVQNSTRSITPGYVYAVPSFLVLCLWNSTATGFTNVYYNFVFTSSN